MSARVEHLTRKKALLIAKQQPPQTIQVLLLIYSGTKDLKDLLEVERSTAFTTLKVRADITAVKPRNELFEVHLNFRKHMSVIGWDQSRTIESD